MPDAGNPNQTADQVSAVPQDASNVAAFGDDAGNPAAAIKYSVPLPGSYSFDRIVPLEAPADWFTDSAKAAGTSLADLGVVAVDSSGKITSVDSARLTALFQQVLPASARPTLRQASQAGMTPATTVAPTGGLGGPVTIARADGSALRQDFLDAMAQQQTEATAAARNRPSSITIPVSGLGQSIAQASVPVSGTQPTLALVETYEVSAFLGDYGLGRTLQTYSLLPGERSQISVQTWRSDQASRDDSTSVFDSSDTAAQTRFGNQLSQQSGSAFQDQGGWAVSVATKASGGINLGLVSAGASVEAGFAANHQEARQSFASSVSQASSEHAAQVNNSRSQAVSSTEASTQDSGSSGQTVREISNTNLRRVLNFVFRELNQTYQVVTALRSVKVAFYNGNPGSADVAEQSDLSRLVAKWVVPASQDTAARAILALTAQCIDDTGTPQPMLEVGTRRSGLFTGWESATLADDGTLVCTDPPLEPTLLWRTKRGPIGQMNSQDEPLPQQANGVVVARTEIVLRTDNVVVEALLGRADALDPYAAALQSLDLQARAAAIQRMALKAARTDAALKLVADAPAEGRVTAWDTVFGEKPGIEVLSAATAANGAASGHPAEQ
jgi:hypothetical protein